MNNPDDLSEAINYNFKNILDVMAPIRTFQPRKRYRNDLSPSTKAVMVQRDKHRNIANKSNDCNDWAAFRSSRNLCVKLQWKDRQEHDKKEADNVTYK